MPDKIIPLNLMDLMDARDRGNPIVSVLQRRAFPMFLQAVQHPDATAARWLAGVVVDALGLAMDRVHDPDYVARQVLRMLANGQAFLEGSEPAEPVYQRMLAEDEAREQIVEEARGGKRCDDCGCELQEGEWGRGELWSCLLCHAREALAEARLDSERMKNALSRAARDLYEASELLSGHELQSCVYDSSMMALAAVAREGK